MHARGVVQWGGGCPTQPAMWGFCRPGRAGGDCAESAMQGWVRHDPQTIALVDRCAPQLCRLRPSPGSNRSGQPACGSEPSGAWRAVDVEEPQPGGLEAVEDHRGNALDELVAERGVGLCLLAQASCVDGDGSHRLRGPDVEATAVGRKEPGKADGVTWPDGLHNDNTATGRLDLDGHIPTAQQEERVGRLALRHEEVAGVECHVPGAPGHEVADVAGKPGEEGMMGDELRDLFGHLSSFDRGLALGPSDGREGQRRRSHSWPLPPRYGHGTRSVPRSSDRVVLNDRIRPGKNTPSCPSSSQRTRYGRPTSGSSARMTASRSNSPTRWHLASILSPIAARTSGASW